VALDDGPELPADGLQALALGDGSLDSRGQIGQQIGLGKEPLPGKGRWGVVVVLQENQGFWQGQITDETGKTRSVIYSPVFGLKIERGA
jgi:hypothetical protein